MTTYAGTAPRAARSRRVKPRERGMIDGVKVIPLRRIPDERGRIMHMLKATDPHFVKFGEIYLRCLGFFGGSNKKLTAILTMRANIPPRE